MRPNFFIKAMSEARKIHRVVVTGIGTVNSHGIGVDAFWEGLLAGRSGIDKVTCFDVSEYPSKVGAEVRDFEIGDFMDVKEARRMTATHTLRWPPQSWPCRTREWT